MGGRQMRPREDGRRFQSTDRRCADPGIGYRSVQVAKLGECIDFSAVFGPVNSVTLMTLRRGRLSLGLGELYWRIGMPGAIGPWETQVHEVKSISHVSTRLDCFRSQP